MKITALMILSFVLMATAALADSYDSGYLGSSTKTEGNGVQKPSDVKITPSGSDQSPVSDSDLDMSPDVTENSASDLPESSPDTE